MIRTMAAKTGVVAIGAALAMAAPDEAGAQAAREAPEGIERFEDGDPAAGAKLYRRLCSGCHGLDGRGGAHTFMPHIGTLTKKDYIEFLPDTYLYTVIAEGGQAVGKSSYMPAWGSELSEVEIKDIIAHIRTLPTY